MTAEETLAGSPVNPGIVALEIITAGTSRVERILERNEADTLERAPRRRRSGHDVGVACRATKPGEVLDHRHDPARLKAGGEREPVRGRDLLVRAERPRAVRVLVVGSLPPVHVEHRSEVHGHASRSHALGEARGQAGGSGPGSWWRPSASPRGSTRPGSPSAGSRLPPRRSSQMARCRRGPMRQGFAEPRRDPKERTLQGGSLRPRRPRPPGSPTRRRSRRRGRRRFALRGAARSRWR